MRMPPMKLGDTTEAAPARRRLLSTWT